MNEQTSFYLDASIREKLKTIKESFLPVKKKMSQIVSEAINIYFNYKRLKKNGYYIIGLEKEVFDESLKIIYPANKTAEEAAIVIIKAFYPSSSKESEDRMVNILSHFIKTIKDVHL